MSQIKRRYIVRLKVNLGGVNEKYEELDFDPTRLTQ